VDFEHWWGVSIAVVMAIMIVLAILGANEGKEFIQECQQEHTKYECIAMWRSGY